MLRAFGNDRTKLTRELRADKMENKIFFLRVSDKIKLCNFVNHFIIQLMYNVKYVELINPLAPEFPFKF